MRRRKKEKKLDGSASLHSTAEESPELYSRGRLAIKHASSTGSSTGPMSNSDATTAAAATATVAGRASSLIATKSRSPPQQRKRSLLGLSSVRDLVEQV